MGRIGSDSENGDTRRVNIGRLWQLRTVLASLAANLVHGGAHFQLLPLCGWLAVRYVGRSGRQGSLIEAALAG
ncbi:hypothetical protein [Vogesella sp.]|uniref:hypothetical protein n=1 Tax=Vogesella sp. TaxID=1904252 RepID=UPI003F66B509